MNKLTPLQFDKNIHPDDLVALKQWFSGPTKVSEKFLQYDPGDFVKFLEENFNRIFKDTTDSVPAELLVWLEGTFMGHVILKVWIMQDSPLKEDLVRVFIALKKRYRAVDYEYKTIERLPYELRPVKLKPIHKMLLAIKQLIEQFEIYFSVVVDKPTTAYLNLLFNNALTKKYSKTGRNLEWNRGDFKKFCKDFGINPASVVKHSPFSAYIETFGKNQDSIYGDPIEYFWNGAFELLGIPPDRKLEFAKKHMMPDDYERYINGSLSVDYLDRKQKKIYEQEKKKSMSYAEKKALDVKQKMEKVIEVRKPQGEGAW